MSKDWIPTQEHFDKLLAWLAPNREQAGEKYEYIRHSLIKIFGWQGCISPEDLADETINRVMRKIDQIMEGYQGDPASYFHGVARKVLLEDRRKELKLVSRLTTIEAAAPDPIDLSDQEDLKFNCLELCLQQMSQDNRDLILHYYQNDKQAKIDFRKELAEQMRITTGTLRVRTHRIRTCLDKCFHECLERSNRA